MAHYYLVEHADWDGPRKIYFGPNTNAEGLNEWMTDTFGSSPECRWQLPNPSLPDVVAFRAHVRYRRNYICELNPEDYGSRNPDDFLKRKPIYLKVMENFEVAGYRFLTQHEEINGKEVIQGESSLEVENEDKPVGDRIRAAYIKSWDGHMSPGDWEGYRRDAAAHEAYLNGEDVYEIIRKEREGGVLTQ